LPFELFKYYIAVQRSTLGSRDPNNPTTFGGYVGTPGQYAAVGTVYHMGAKI